MNNIQRGINKLKIGIIILGFLLLIPLTRFITVSPEIISTQDLDISNKCATK